MTLKNCPVTIQTFFESPHSKLWLLFVKEQVKSKSTKLHQKCCQHSKQKYFPFQADYFQRTVLKIEGDNIGAVDVAHQLEILRANIMLRKEENFIDADTEDEKNKLIDMGYDGKDMEEIFMKFYGEKLNSLIS